MFEPIQVSYVDGRLASSSVSSGIIPGDKLMNTLHTAGFRESWGQPWG
jgi:hypothetical protein